jgi:hypothetical protein
MMPGDVLGTNLFNFQTNSFVLTQGPIFTQILLADEINRTPPKTQAALLQAMNERQVTIDKQTFSLSDEFMVAATQNPIEQQGTYPLPEAQLDRFLFKLVIDYPNRDEEREIVRRHGHRSAMPRISDFDVEPKVDGASLAAARGFTSEVRLTDSLVDYIVDIVRATRRHPAIETGASPRAANMMARRPGLRRHLWARFRHSRRHQVPGRSAFASPHRHVSGFRDRGCDQRTDLECHRRSDVRSKMTCSDDAPYAESRFSVCVFRTALAFDRVSMARELVFFAALSRGGPGVHGGGPDGNPAKPPPAGRTARAGPALRRPIRRRRSQPFG